MNKHIKIIIVQVIFLFVVVAVIYLVYPRTNINVSGNAVNFESGNAKTIIISKNPDFSNSRFIDINKNTLISLEPGTYYWKASNNFIEGWSKKFEIKSEVGLKIEEDETESELVNIGNVRVNVTRNKEGVMVGHIILEPDEKEKIANENNENYEGRQDD
ncbi:hypothetical protein FJZ19_04370 [Candidatus Pacearchaeota archaeon]|nr:hypothetical protein [Candidatus Pacearchaeota archaeon]